MEGVPQDGIGAIIERHQWWHVAVLADQHVGGSQQLGGQLSGRNPASSCVEPSANNYGTAECQMHLFEEIIKIHFWLLRQLSNCQLKGVRKGCLQVQLTTDPA